MKEKDVDRLTAEELIENFPESYDGEDEHLEPTKLPAPVPTVRKPEGDAELKDDLNYVRENLYDAMEKTSASLARAMDILEMADKAYPFEIVSTLTETMARLGGALVDLHEKKKKLEQVEKPEEPKSTTINSEQTVVVAGTLQDMLNALSGIKKA